MNRIEIFSDSSDAKIQLAESKRELDAFLYRASHNLKGPLARLEGMTQLLAMQSESPEMAMTIQLVESLTQEMQGVINELIHIQGLFNGQPIKSEVNPEQLLQDVIGSLRPKYPSVSLNQHIQNDRAWHTDLTLVKIIFQQLLGNAYAFQRKSNAVSEVVFRFFWEGDTAIIEVQDNGVGIENEQIERIFELFYKGTLAPEGSGLGLYLVRKSVAQLKGRIEVQSKPQQYSLFRITLPS
ncbi:MAG: sensor histidine kinase [Bacteroidia bacterium]